MEIFVTVLKQLLYFFAVLLVLCILWCFAGCRSSQKLTQESSKESRTDSTALVQRVRLDTIQVPKESASALVPARWLYDNPGTPYQATSGRATVSIRLVHDTVQVQADCDSLQKVVASINTQLYRLQQQQTERQSSEVVHTVKVPWQLQMIGWLVVAVVVGYLVLSAVKFFKPVL